MNVQDMIPTRFCPGHPYMSWSFSANAWIDPIGNVVKQQTPKPKIVKLYCTITGSYALADSWEELEKRLFANYEGRYKYDFETVFDTPVAIIEERPQGLHFIRLSDNKEFHMSHGYSPALQKEEPTI